MSNLRKVERLTLGDEATFYGCCGVFDLCGDNDLISLSLAGVSPLLDYIGWKPTDICVLERNFIDRYLPGEGDPRQGWVGDACADPNSVDWATVAFRIEDFGRLRRSAPVQDATRNSMRLCEAQPRYRLDGMRINDDREYNAVMVAEVMVQDLNLMVINGNSSTAGQFDGLEQLVKTGYTDFKGVRATTMDSTIVDWNGNGLDGGAGATWTDERGSRNIDATYSFTDMLRSYVRILKKRIKNSGLGVANLQYGDVVLVATSEMVEAILDHFTGWSVVVGGQYNEANIDVLAARQFRETLAGELFRAPNGNTIQSEGTITIHGLRIPLISHDWGLQSGSTSDIYMLVGGVGSRQTLYGEYNNMNRVVADYPDADFAASDGGKMLHILNDTDWTCVLEGSEFQGRVVAYAPWTLVKISNVSAETVGGTLDNDPLSSSFFPGGSSYSVAECN